MDKEKLIIIGAGLTGLYAAYLLQDQYDITIIEARDRPGGRIYTCDGHDMGPSWVWPHQKHILQLIESLGLTLFTQYDQGDALYDVPAGVQRFQSPPSPASYRMNGGLVNLITAINDHLTDVTMIMNEPVKRIQEMSNGLQVTTATRSIDAYYVLCTLPPRLAASHIEYTPPLPQDTLQSLNAVPTWMGYAQKCVITFKSAFWREKGLSGFTFSHVGPLSEIHDACTRDEAALFGFAHSNALANDFELHVKAQIGRLFGLEFVEQIINIHTVDWRKESYSSTVLDHKPLSTHPEYGHTCSHFKNKLYFIGTESSFDNGGYLEGAVVSAKSVIEKLKKK